MKKSSARARSFALLAALVVGVGGVVISRGSSIDVTATPVVRGRAVEAVYATGTVEAELRIEVKAKTAGSIVELLVREGSQVKKGDLLARIENSAAVHDLARGNAELSAASALAGRNAPQLGELRARARAIRAELTTARAELARSEALHRAGGVPEAQLDRVRGHVEQLEGALAANAAQQRTARIDLSTNVARQTAVVKSLAARVDDTEVRAPLDGVVLSRRVELGEVVSVNQPLLLVGDTRSLILEVLVDEADVSRVSDGRAGKPASQVAISLLAFPQQAFPGRVLEILPDADRTKKSFLVKVALERRPDGLRSGMTAEVNMITSEREGLLAPATSESEGQVWLVQDGAAVPTKVKTGIRDPLRIELLEGVKEGDLVIIDGHDALRAGQSVRVTQRAPDKLEPMPDLASAAQMSL